MKLVLVLVLGLGFVTVIVLKENDRVGFEKEQKG